MHAQWQDNAPVQYTITFSSHGGTDVTAITQNAGTPVPRPVPDPAKDGYTFLGWFSAESGGAAYTWPHTLTANVTMHAQWWNNADGLPPAQYTITFNTHGGSAVTAVPGYAGTAIAKPAPDPARAGYTFTGWFSTETGGTEYAWPHTLTGNLTMHAQWQAVPVYTITFNSHGGSNVAAITQNAGTQVSKPSLDPVKSGYTFTGWFSDETGGTKYEWPYTLTGNLTMHAQWQAVPVYTITFSSHGGTDVTAITQNAGTPVPRPVPDPVKDGYTFLGWYSAETGGTAYTWPHTLTASVTMHAQWQVVPVNIDTEDFGPSAAIAATFDIATRGNWNAALAAIQAGGNNKNYVINLTDDVTYILGISGSATFGSVTGVIVSLRGNKSLELTPFANASGDGNGSLLRIGDQQTLILRESSLVGKKDNIAALVTVLSGGSFTMRSGKISGNSITAPSAYGSGVNVSGSFTMSGGEISGNSSITTISSFGGGVYVYASGSFTMSGGEISGNSSNTTTVCFGGGVSVSGGDFTMTGGEISGNTASEGGGVFVYGGGDFTMSGGEISGNSSSPSGYGGGGVSVSSGDFTMSDGEISGNTASKGGGVLVFDGDFTMSGGEISGNTATSYGGGGVYVSDGDLTMSGGEISGNSATEDGGGVYVSDGDFAMSGGEISGNSATSYGGGVYLQNNDNGYFSKTGGGVIYGSNTTGSLRNTAGHGNTWGHALYYQAGDYPYTFYYRDTTLNAGDNISTDDTLPDDSGQTVGNWTKQ
jgi:uncharacterized repeat protein (TIGR02543 family)